MDSRLKLEAAKRDSAAAQTSQTAAAAPAATPTAPAATPPPLLRTPTAATPHSVASSRVQTLEIISQGHCDDGGVLLFGQLLQWMDIAACLSAERHAHLHYRLQARGHAPGPTPTHAHRRANIHAGW